MAEDYVDYAVNLVFTPTPSLGSYGYNTSAQKYPLNAVSTLSYLKSPLRRPRILETWSPLEIATFEAAISEYGKEFVSIQKEIGTKTTRQVIDFYYIWKKTSHYQEWKRIYGVTGGDDAATTESNEGE